MAPASDENVLIRVRDVAVSYRAFEEHRVGLRERIASGQFKRRSREIRAVQGVSLEVRRGETIGIVGTNGSGKSTLMGAMAGLLPVESGTIEARSRPVLLSVGAALRPKLSGRNNITLGCLAMGVSRIQALQMIDEIVEFSGLSEVIDLPMSTYSSGMRSRLTFSIATSISPQILLIDEALAVGDHTFREKSAGRMDEIRSAAGGVVLVSHNLDEVRRSCSRVIWLDRGRVFADGPTVETLDKYLSDRSSPG